VIVSGTASPLGSVKLLIGADEVADETAALDGSWSHQFDLIPEGDLTFSAKELDDFGNRSAASNLVHVHVDRTRPVVTISGHPPARTNLTNALFGLTASEQGVDFECALDAGAWQSCGDAPDFGGLAEGAHVLKVRGTDSTGNTTLADAIFNWTIDVTAPPAPTIDTPAEGVTVTNARPPVSGHAEPGASVELFVGAASQGTAPVSSGSGTWTLTPAAALAQGSIQVKARTTDAAGNSSPLSAVRSFTIDSVAPITTIQGAPALPTNAATVTVTFSANDLAATFTCSVDNLSFAACSSPFAINSLGEGNHSLRVRAKDVAGNVEAPPALVNFRIDRAAPIGQSSLIEGSSVPTGVPAFAIASNDSTATAQCKIDNGSYVPCAGNYRPNVSIGIHALTIRFTDAAGNAGDQVIAFNVTAPEPPPNYYEQPPQPAACQVLGADGLTTGKLSILTATSKKRTLTFGVKAGANSLIRAEVIESGATIGSGVFAVDGRKGKFKLKLKRDPSVGQKVELAVRFYSVKREYGTAHLALAVAKSGIRIAASAQSTIDVVCPKPIGPSNRPSFTAKDAVAGQRSFFFKSNGKYPALVAFKVTRAGAAKPVLSTLVVTPASPAALKVKLSGSAKLARGAYKFSFEAISAGGLTSSGRGAFSVR
jgi:hypothetical protein